MACSVALPCGNADLSPEAMMVGNDISSAPARRAAYSISAATSASFTPGRSTSSARSNSVAPSRTAARINPISSSSFTMRSRSTSPTVFRNRRPPGRMIHRPVFFPPRSGVRLQSQSPTPSISCAARFHPLPHRGQHRLARNHHLRALHFRSPLRVISDIRKENAPRLRRPAESQRSR